MKQIKWLLAAFFIMGLVLTDGCQSRQLANGGVYRGDKVLYQADQTIVGSYDVLHAFVKFEYDNREALTKISPDIRKSADAVRGNAQRWVTSAINLREAYAKEPSTENKNNLESAITILKQALLEAQNYMTQTIGK